MQSALASAAHQNYGTAVEAAMPNVSDSMDSTAKLLSELNDRLRQLSSIVHGPQPEEQCAPDRAPNGMREMAQYVNSAAQRALRFVDQISGGLTGK